MILNRHEFENHPRDAAPSIESFALRQILHRLEISTKGRGFVEITAPISAWVSAQKVASGLITVFCRHTSASLLIQENADPDVLADLERFFSRLAPDDERLYLHRSEGSDDMPAHIRAALTQTQLAIPILAGRLGLGTWQGIYLFEHRQGPHRREILLHLLGDAH